VRRYSILHPLFMSFFSKSLYQDIARNWPGLCFTYLFSVLALCAIPGVLKFQSEFSYIINREAPKYVRQLPAITIEKGKVSIDKPEPYFISDEKTGAHWAVIDTTGGITSLEGSKAVLLLTKTSLIVKSDDRESRTLDLSGIDNLVVDRSSMYTILESLEDWVAVFVYPFAVIFSFLYRVIEVLILALMGTLIAKTVKTSLDYRTLVRLASVSITPVLICGAFLVLAGAEVPYWPLASFILSLAYLFFAIKANVGSPA